MLVAIIVCAPCTNSLIRRQQTAGWHSYFEQPWLPSSALTKPLLNCHRSTLITHCSVHCLGRDRRWHRVYWSPLASNGIASKVQHANYKDTPVSRRSPSAVATSTGYTGAGSVLPSCGRPLSSGRYAQTINKSYWAGLYYRQQRDKGCNHQAAVRALAFKWIRILYRCWQTHTPYNEALYLKALKRRGSPLLNQIELRATPQATI